MYTQTNRFRRDDDDRNENVIPQTQKVWTHGHRKQRRKDKPARRFTAGKRDKHNADITNNTTNGNITSLHDITLKIRKLYDDVASEFTSAVTNNNLLSTPFKPINYKRIHKRWKNKKFKQQVGGADCLDNTRLKSLTVMEDPDGDGNTFIVTNNSTDRNVTGSLDAVVKELMKQPNPPGTTAPVKFPIVAPPAAPAPPPPGTVPVPVDPNQPDADIDGSLTLTLKQYNSADFKKMYGAAKPANPTPALPVLPSTQPQAAVTDPVVKRKQLLLKAVTAIAIIGATGATAKSEPIKPPVADKPVPETEAGETEAEKKRKLQKQLALIAAATSISGLGALGATEDTDTKKRLEDKEAELEKIRKENEETAKRNYKFLTAVAAIAGIAAAGAIEGPEPAPAPPEPVEVEAVSVESKLNDEDFAWDSLYAKWMQIIRTQQYKTEAERDILWDEDKEVSPGSIPNFEPANLTRADFEVMLKNANDGKNVSNIDPKYKSKKVYQNINKWVTKWKELGGAIRTFISFKTGDKKNKEEAHSGDPHKITNADLVIDKVLSKKIPVIRNSDTIKQIFTKFTTWIDNSGNMEKLIDAFNTLDITPFALTNDPTKNIEVVKGFIENPNEPQGESEIDVLKTENKRRRRNQKVIICKLILLKLLAGAGDNPNIINSFYTYQGNKNFFDDVIGKINENSDERATIIEKLREVSDVQFNQMFVHYNPKFINPAGDDSKNRKKPVLPKLLSESFPYKESPGALGAGGAKIGPKTDADDDSKDLLNLKDVLYGKFYSVWDSSVIGNQARYENGKFESLVKILTGGGNVILFGYGYSGSGKTYTLTNEDAAKPEDWGIGPKLVASLLNDVKTSSVTYSATVEELYCADITYSLIAGFSYPGVIGSRNNMISYTRKIDNSTDINNLITLMKEVKTIRLNAGRIKATVNNAESSRGHLFYTIAFSGASQSIGNLVICDMGGREDPLEMAKQTYIVTAAGNPAGNKHIGCLAKKIGPSSKGGDRYSIWPKKEPEPGSDIRVIAYDSEDIIINSKYYTIKSIMSDTEDAKSNVIIDHKILDAFRYFNAGSNPKALSVYLNRYATSYYKDPKISETLENFFISCKEGFFINETINHLTAYINYLSMMGETLVANKVMPTSISQLSGYNIASDNTHYDPTHFIQDPQRVIYEIEKTYNANDLGRQSIQQIINTAGGKVANIIGQTDYFGIITKLFSLKRPRESKSSVICVMACIRTSHKNTSDSYRLATERTLNFAISVSASNPALKEVMTEQFDISGLKTSDDDINPDKTGSFLLVGPGSYNEAAVAKYVAEGALTRNRQSKLFNGRPKPKTEIEAKRLLNEYLNSSEYNAWENHYIKQGENPLNKEKIKSSFKPIISNGGTRRKHKSGGNKKTRRIRNRTK